MTLKELKSQIEQFVPYNEQEKNDKTEILKHFEQATNILTRENQTAHVTVSAWIVNEDRKKVLMAYHNIYDSWAWLGGHADGNADLKEVVRKEIQEESGLSEFKFILEDIFSLEILPVFGHEKRGRYVSSHLHLNVTFLLEADSSLPIRIKEDENSEIGWIDVTDIPNKSSEQWFVERIYSKLCQKMTKA